MFICFQVLPDGVNVQPALMREGAFAHVRHIVDGGEIGDFKQTGV